MKTWKYVSGALLAALVAIPTARIILDHPASDPGEYQHGQGQQISIIDGDYPIYQSLEEIISSSDLVIQGVVRDVLPSYRVRPALYDQLPPAKRQVAGYLKTNATVSVEEVLWGDPELESSTISVSHMGGTLGREVHIMEGQPVSKAGEEYLFFLRKSSSSETYIIVGGGKQGRYPLRGGYVFQDKSDAHILPLAEVLGGKTVEGIKKELSDFTHHPKS